MTLLELCTEVARAVESDGDSAVSTSNITFAGPLSGIVRRNVKLFSRDALLFYKLKSTFNLTAGESQFNISSAGVCPDMIFHPVNVWIGGNALAEVTISQMEQVASTHSLPQSAPTKYAIVSSGVIQLDARIPATLPTNNSISGYCDHPDMTVDASDVQVPMELEDALVLYCAVAFMRSAVSDEVGMNRLRAYSQSAYRAVEDYAARQKVRHMGESSRRK